MYASVKEEVLTEEIRKEIRKYYPHAYGYCSSKHYLIVKLGARISWSFSKSPTPPDSDYKTLQCEDNIDQFMALVRARNVGGNIDKKTVKEGDYITCVKDVRHLHLEFIKGDIVRVVQVKYGVRARGRKTGDFTINGGTDFTSHFRMSTYQEIYDQQTKTMEKELKGYKLIKEEFKQAAKSIVGWEDTPYVPRELIFGYLTAKKSQDQAIEKLKEAGVLDLWYEPIYEEEKKTFDITGHGNFITIMGGKAFFKDEEITQYVINIVRKYSVSNPLESNGGKRLCDVQDVTFSRTGCINAPTKLSDWKKVYELMQETK